jgi:tape measure domain-containing protein
MANAKIRLSMDGAAQVINDLDGVEGKFSSVKKEVNAVKITMGSLGSAVAALGGAFLIKEFVQMADAVSLMDSRLKLATKSAADFNQAQKDIYAIAQANNVGLKETATLYTRLSDPILRLGGSTKEVGAIVDAFATSLRVGGASTEEASAATLQFAQAMGSGKLQGDEFKSIAEASPRFMKALADGMGVPIEKLKSMSSEGKLTADVVGNALVSSLGKLKDEAKTLPDTVGGAFTRMQNDILLAVNDANKSSNLTLGIADLINEVRKLIPLVKDQLVGAMGSVGAWIANNKKELGDVWETVKSIVGDVWEMAKGFVSVAGFITEVGLKSEFIKTTLESVRILLAAFQDGVKIIGAAFAALGSRILEVVLSPLQLVLIASAKIAGVFNESLGKKISGLSDDIAQFANAGKQYGGMVVDAFANGESNLALLGNSLGKAREETKLVTGETIKAAGAYTTLKSAVTGLSDAEKKAKEDAQKEAEKAEKARASFIAGLEKEAATIGLSAVQIKLYEAGLLGIKGAQLDYVEQILNSNEARKASQKSYDDLYAASTKELQSLDDQIKKQQDYNSQIGLTKSQIEALTASRLRDEAAVNRAKADAINTNPASTMADLPIAKGYSDQATKQDSLAALKDIGAAREEAAKALEELNKSLDPTKAQSFGDALRGSFVGVGDSISKMTTQLQAFGIKQAQTDKDKKNAALALNGNLITQAKYTQNIAEIDRRASQDKIALYSDIAGAAKNMFDKNSDGYKALEIVQAALNVQGAIGAVVAQGQGDPYTAFGRMAAMAAAVASLGISINGAFSGSEDTRAKDIQAKAGTGSILGDATAKSDSIAKAVELTARNSGLGLAHFSSMDRSLQSLVTNISGLTDLLVRVPGITGAVPGVKTGYETVGGVMGNILGTNAKSGAAQGALVGSIFGPLGTAAGALLGGVVSKAVSKLFGTNTTLIDQGVQFGKQTIGSVTSDGSLEGSGYATVNTKKKGFGITYSNKTNDQLSGLPADVQQQFGLVISSLTDTVRSSAQSLGLAGGDFNHRLNNFTIDLGKISTKGLKPEEITKQFEAIFSKLGDDLASLVGSKSVLGVKFGDGIKEFAKAGEGPLQTLARVANDSIQVNDVLSVLGKSISAVGLAGIRAREGLIEAAGGLDKLTSGTKFYVDNFLTDEERVKPIKASVDKALGSLGLSWVKTIDDFKYVIGKLNLNDVGAQKIYAQLLDIAPAFKTVADYNDSIAKAAADEAAKKAQAQQDELEAQTKIADEAKRASDQLKDAAVQMQAYRQSLYTGSNSPLGGAQTYALTRANLAGATGDNYKDLVSSFLDKSKKQSRTADQYASDVAYADSILRGLQASTLTAADKSLVPAVAASASTPLISPSTATANLINTVSNPDANSAAMLAELKRVSAELAALRSEQQAQAVAQIQAAQTTAKALTKFDRDGLPETRV